MGLYRSVHCFSADYDPKYISAGTVPRKYIDELPDNMHSLMPSLEFMGSLPSMEVSSSSDL
jgi:hypothetical protein